MGLGGIDLAGLDTLIIFVVCLIGLILFTSLLLARFSDRKKTARWVSLIVWVGWFFSFGIVLFIPLDVVSSRHELCHNATSLNETDVGGQDITGSELCEHASGISVLEVETQTVAAIWRTIYWTVFVLCWAVYPITNGFSCAAQFTVQERLVQALTRNLLYYGTLGLIGVIGLTYLLSRSLLTWQAILGILMAISNAYGLCVVLALLSYGLVEIPKKLWRTADRTTKQRYYQFELVSFLDDLERAKEDLWETMRLVKKYSEQVALEHPFYPYVHRMILELPQEYNDVIHGEGVADMKYDALVALHYRVMYADKEYKRCRWLYQHTVNKAFNLEDKISSETATDKVMHWSFVSRNPSNAWQKFLYHGEWVWFTHLERIALRTTCCLYGLLSLCVVWSESFYWLMYQDNGVPPLSVFYWIVQGDHEMMTQWLAVFAPIAFIAFNAYWSLFQVRVLNYYRILPNQLTEASSMLYSGYYVSRFTAPLVYNYLLMIGDTTSGFIKIMGAPRTVIPLLGLEFIKYCPTILALLCFMNLFNIWTRMIRFCCSTRFARFAYDSDFNDERIDRGKELLHRERSLRQRGMGLSIDQRDFRGSKKKAPQQPSTVRDLFFGKKKEKESPQPMDKKSNVKKAKKDWRQIELEEV